MNHLRAESFFCAFLLVAFVTLATAGAVETRGVDHNISGNTYINRTDNCKVSMPVAGNWSMALKNRDGKVLEFGNTKLYEVSGTVLIGRYPLMTLDMIKLGAANKYGNDALLNTVDVNGKRAILVERTLVLQKQKVATRTYIIVKDSIPKKEGQGWTEGVVYTLVFSYLNSGDQDKEFLKQIENIVQSFSYLDEKTAKTSLADPKGK